MRYKERHYLFTMYFLSVRIIIITPTSCQYPEERCFAGKLAKTSEKEDLQETNNKIGKNTNVEHRLLTTSVLVLEGVVRCDRG